jgi:hypothetical protein
LTDLAALGALRDELAHCQQLNVAVQDFLRAWSGVSAKRNPAVMLDQASLPWFAELNRSLLDRLGDGAFRERIRFSTRQMRALAEEIAERAEGSVDASALRRLISEGAAFGNGTVDAPMLFERA